MVFHSKAAKGKVYPNCKHFFSKSKQESWFQDDVIKRIINHVDGATVVEGLVLRDRDGNIIPPEYLSTGCKTAILIWEYPDLVFNVTYCGNNAFACVADICKHYDRTILTYRYLPVELLKDVILQKDYCSISLEEYDDKVEEWLEEIYND